MEVYTQQLVAFDTLVFSSLSCYPSVKDVCLLVMLTSSPPASNVTRLGHNTKHLLHRLLVNSSTITSDEGSGGLGILSVCNMDKSLPRSNDMVLYHDFLLEFFRDPVRSQQYCLCGDTYASAAFECLQLLTW